MSLTGSVAIITGGARGIGKAITAALLQNKAKVNIFDVNVKEGEKTQCEFEAEYGKGMAKFIKCDVSNKDVLTGAISDVFKQHGRLDVLCNNAGVHSEKSDDLEKIILTDLISVIRGTTLALQYMDNTKGGHGGNIINIGSVAGLTFLPESSYSPGHFAYYAAKQGVVFYSRFIAPEAMKVGVRVNCICPSAIETQMLKEFLLENPPAKSILEHRGVQSVDTVAKGFMELLNDETKVGATMRISVQNGIDYHSFPEVQVPF